MGDYSIFLKVHKIFKEYQTLLKNKSRQTPVETQKRASNEKVSKSLFDISSKDWEKSVRLDKCRSSEAKLEDLACYDDQKSKQ